MRRLARLVRRHRAATGVVVLTGVSLILFVLLWFQPQKLFIDDHINEALPSGLVGVGDVVAPPATVSPRPGPTRTGPAAALLSRGSFISRGHGTAGAASVYRLPDGGLLLRLDDLRTTNGPDLRVRLSPHGTGADNGDINDGALDLGGLKGNIGDQNYAIPAGTDLNAYRSVIIWCRRFTYVFGAAPVTADS
jgi:hypothetical protein